MIVDTNTSETFALESPTPGRVPPRVIEELRSCYRSARDFSTAFGEAVKTQSEKYTVHAGALRKYIAALEGDKLEEVEKEIVDLARMIDEAS